MRRWPQGEPIESVVLFIFLTNVQGTAFTRLEPDVLCAMVRGYVRLLTAFSRASPLLTYSSQPWQVEHRYRIPGHSAARAAQRVH